MTDRPPPDEAARRRIEDDLDATLFVEAGAGSGKTSALVGRVLALVTSGAATLDSVAAITFTEKAAAELSDRIRAGLERACMDGDGTPEAERCRIALEQLDAAAIGTLHAFAQRLLVEHPVAAGLPPRVEVLDEVSSQVAFDDQWARFLDELLGDPHLERALLLLDAAGVRPESFRVIAQRFEANWDLVEERLDADPPESPDPRALFSARMALVRAVCGEPCLDPDDKLKRKLDAFGALADELAATEDEYDLVEGLQRLEQVKFGVGGKQSSFHCPVDELKARANDARDQLVAVRQEVCAAAGRQVATAVGRFTLAAARSRQQAGRLQFHDLLVLARRLLRDPHHGPQVRARLHDRYRRLLLDEFQDTDPIQIELAARIAAAAPGQADAGERGWAEVTVEPGALFLVGDPKQSIYRFRRADIVTFLAAKRRFGTETGGLVELTANFRTTRPVLDWVNRTFGALMAPDPSSDGDRPTQAEYLPLDPVRPAAPSGPGVAVVGRNPHPAGTRADPMRVAEAADVAAAVTRAVEEGWPVSDSGGWRPARLGDVAILVPARTSLPFLEEALEQAGIPFRTESSSLVYATRAVRDVLMVLRAVADPTDELSIVSALRTPLLACGDDDLFRFRRERGGRFDFLGGLPESVPADDPVRYGLTYLRSLYDERYWASPSRLLMRITEERRAFELGFSEGRPRDVWRRLRFVIDQARAWSDTTGGNLRQYLAWVNRQASEGSRVSEAVLPEHDDDAVRIMTIHGAKGLEFPITVVSGLSTAPRGRTARAEAAFPPDEPCIAYRFGRGVATADYDQWQAVDEQMGLHERIRLLYVACTRARDHLVVSLHRSVRRQPPSRSALTGAELLVAGMGDMLDELPDAAATDATPAAVAPSPARPPQPFEEWSEATAEALARAARSRTVAATALGDEGQHEPEVDPGLQKRPRDLDLPPWLKGRYGTAVGRAVHGVLQTVDLATGAGLADAAAAQCQAEAVTDRAEEVERLARAALGSAVVTEAARHRHWREMFVGAPVAGRVLEGYLDLLYRGPDGLVVVDYKTAATDDPAELDRRALGYRRQGAAYALAVERATGETVHAVVFLFLTPTGAVERRVRDLSRAVADLDGLVAAGAEVVVDP